jgi:hypothetical protein
MALRLMLVSFLQKKDAIPSPPSLIAIETSGPPRAHAKADKETFKVAN